MEKAPSAEQQAQLRVAVIRILEREGKSMKAIDIAYTLGYTMKRFVNPILYQLQKEGVVTIVNAVPPRWILTKLIPGCESFSSDPPRPPGAHPYDQPSGSVVPKLKTSIDDTELQAIVQKMLRESEGSLTALEIADAQGTTKANVNRVLYAMAKENIIKGTSDLPPLWSLAGSSCTKPPDSEVDSPLEGGSRPEKGPNTPIKEKADTESNDDVDLTGLKEALPPMGERLAALDKNPISALYEFAKAHDDLDCSIKILNSSGPPHNPRFQAAAQLENFTFPSVWGKRKQEARTLAAEAAMEILQLPESQAFPDCEVKLEKTSKPAPESVAKPAPPEVRKEHNNFRPGMLAAVHEMRAMQEELRFARVNNRNMSRQPNIAHQAGRGIYNPRFLHSVNESEHKEDAISEIVARQNEIRLSAAENLGERCFVLQGGRGIGYNRAPESCYRDA